MFKGSLVAIITPMLKDYSIDYQSFEKLIEYHISHKTDGIVAVGTTGESPTLSHQEHKEVLRFCVKQIANRVPLIAGAGSNNTAEAIDFAKFAKEVKADASLQITPYYNRPSQEGLIHHFNLIAKAVAMPHILYNVPSRTSCDLLPETTIKLAKTKNIIGIKEAAADGVSRVNKLINETDDDFLVLSGDDTTLDGFLKEGGHGVISVSANIAAGQMQQLCEFSRKGEFEKMSQIQEKLIDLHRILFSEPSPTPLKWAMKHLAMAGDYVRSPLIPFTNKHKTELLEAIKKAGIVSNYR